MRSGKKHSIQLRNSFAVFLGFMFASLSVMGQQVTYSHGELSAVNVPEKTMALTSTCQAPPFRPCLSYDVTDAKLNMQFSLDNPFAYQGTPFQGEVTLRVYADVHCSASIPVDVTKTLVLNEQTVAQYAEVDFTGVAEEIDQLRVEVLSYTAPQGYEGQVELKVWTTQKFVHLYEQQGTEALGVNALNAAQSSFSWRVTPLDPRCTYPSYQFQLLRLHNTNELFAKGVAGEPYTAFIDWEKALNIETQSQQTALTLTMTEGTGYYVWRVRGIGDANAGGIANPDNWGPWSDFTGFEQGNTVQITGTSNVLFYYDQFDNDKNWIYTRVFSEGGEGMQSRVGESIVYANGLNQVEQSQAKISSKDQVLATQSVVDYSGRDAFQTVPVPVDGKTHFNYVERLVETESGELYTAKFFDADGNYKSPEQVDMQGDFGYYNGTNQDQVADLEGYPYVRRLFYNDGTTRVKEQGSAGGTHHIQETGGKTLRTFYASPSETELTSIFGNEAPDNEGVHKVIEVDANNSAVVRYIDISGQTLAVCFGVNGSNTHDQEEGTLLGLQSQQGATLVVTDEIDETSEEGEFANRMAKILHLLEETQIDLTYNLTANEFQESCLNYCSTCDYRVVFRIVNVEDPENPVLEHVENLDPATCGSGGTFNVNLSQVLDAGTYEISRTLTTANVDPSASIRATHLDQHLFNVETQYRNQIQTELQQVYDYLDTEDIVGLYTYLGVTDLDNVADDAEVVKTLSCTDVTLPVIPCQENDCSPAYGAFSSYLIEQLEIQGYDEASALQELTYEYAPGLVATYTQTELDDWFVNLQQDYFPARCDEIWGCWQNVVLNYTEMKNLEAETNADENQTEFGNYTFHLINAFLTCIGTEIEGKSTAATGPTGYLTNAHKYFYYVEGSNPDCEGTVCGGAVCTSTDFTNFTSGEWNDLYLCVKHYKAGGDITDNEAELETACQTACEERRDAFETSILTMLHNDGQVVEGDEFYYTLQDVWSTDLLANPDAPIPAGTTPDVTLFEVSCMLDAVMEECLSYCDVTVETDPQSGEITNVGTIQEIENLQKAMTYDFELSLKTGSNCPNGASELNSPSGNQGLGYDFVHIWDKTFGGSSGDKLTNAIMLEDGNYLLAGRSSSELNLAGGKTSGHLGSGDIWLIKVDPSGQRIWDARYGTNDYDNVIAMIEAEDNSIYFGGVTQSVDPGGILVKLDANGVFQWDQILFDQVTHITELNSGNLMIAGTTNDLHTYISTGVDFVVQTVSPQGVVIGSPHYYGGNGLDLGTVTDRRMSPAQRSNASNESYLFMISSLSEPGVADLSGLPAGTDYHQRTSYHYGKSDYWLLNIDANGDLVWEQSFGGTENDVGANVIAKPGGAGYLISGCSESIGYPVVPPGVNNFKRADLPANKEHWIVEIDNGGDLIHDWAYNIDGNVGSSPINSFIQESVNGYMLVGVQSEMASPNYYAQVIRLSSDMEPTWEVLVGADGSFDPAIGLFEVGPDKFLLAYTAEEDADPVHGQTQNSFGNKDYGLIEFEVQKNCGFQDFCFNWVPPRELSNEEVHVFQPWTCEKVVTEQLYEDLSKQIDRFVAQRLEAVRAEYMQQCAEPKNVQDDFSMSYPLGYHHYTLYYYDRAGNLIKTVPPEGVKRNQSYTRNDVPAHTFVTDYEYNSLGQLVRQHTPDGGQTQFWYDALGRIRFSQSAQQSEDEEYSYIKYDNLGRIIESGESTEDYANFLTHTNDYTFPTTTDEFVKTVYTKPQAGVLFSDGSTQRYLRNRVSYVYNQDDSYTYYSYDPHGNVEWLIQDIPGLGKQYVAYEYDLISGNVLRVKYNEGQPDQLFHQYAYDSDNRLILAETSQDGKLWDKEAEYDYFLHGPLQRMVTGQHEVQGTDFTYTALGWLKGINHTSLDPNKDPGKDGSSVAKDAFGSVLNYFRGDFKHANSPMTSEQADHLEANADLYNGNISSWAFQTQRADHVLPGDVQYDGQQLGFKYRYDELNRIKTARFNTKAQGGVWTERSDYAVDYQYDGNGNLTQLRRDGYEAEGLLMDNLSYDYNYDDPGVDYFEINNQLKSVTDLSLASNYDTDLDGTYAYTYDKDGQLIADPGNDIVEIKWNAFGKVEEVIKTDGERLLFAYDAALNRIKKEVIPAVGSNADPRTLYYTRDAQGNVLATYEKVEKTIPTGTKDEISLIEQPLYGSKRIGMLSTPVLLKEVFHENGNTTEVLPVDYQHVSEPQHIRTSFKMYYTPYDPYLQNAYTYHYSSDMSSGVPVTTYQSGVFGNPGDLITQAEDDNGNTVVSAYGWSYDWYGTHYEDITLMNSSNQVLAGGTGFNAEVDRKAVLFEAPAANTYYMLTQTGVGNLYSHTLDMSGSGSVTSINQLVNSDIYVDAYAVLENHGTAVDTRIYMLRINGSATELVYLPVDGSGFGIPVVLDSYGLIVNDAELQLSADGSQLGVYLNDGNIHVYDLSSDYSMAQLNTTLNVGTVTQLGSMDFSPLGQYIFYTKTENTTSTLNRIRLIDGQIENVLNYTGSVRRSADGKMYATLLTHFYDRHLMQINNPDGPTMGLFPYELITDDFYFVEILDRDLPLQTHKIYGSDASICSRTVGGKQYELTDHLGNVRAVITDRKVEEQGSIIFTDHFDNKLIANQGFTSSQHDWEVIQAGDETEIESGRLKVTPDGFGGGVNRSFPTEVGKYYIFSVMINKNTASEVGVALVGGTQFYAQQTVTAAGDIQLSIPFVAVDTELGVGIALAQADPQGVVFHVDNVKLEEEYFQPGWYSYGTSETHMENGQLHIDQSVYQAGTDYVFDTEPGHTYTIDLDAELLQGTEYGIAIWDAINSNFISFQNYSASGHVTYNFTANSTLSHLKLWNPNQVGLSEFTFDNVVIRDNNENTYLAEVLTTTDYYPFGMEMPGRSVSSEDYRYGFNGMEKDDEMKGKSNSYDFGARMYDPRVGRWMSIDPIERSSISPYVGFDNNPIVYVDPDGREINLSTLNAFQQSLIIAAVNQYLEVAGLSVQLNPTTGNLDFVQSAARVNMSRNRLRRDVGFGTPQSDDAAKATVLINMINSPLARQVVLGNSINGETLSAMSNGNLLLDIDDVQYWQSFLAGENNVDIRRRVFNAIDAELAQDLAQILQPAVDALPMSPRAQRRAAADQRFRMNQIIRENNRRANARRRAIRDAGVNRRKSQKRRNGVQRRSALRKNGTFMRRRGSRLVIRFGGNGGRGLSKRRRGKKLFRKRARF